MSHSHITFTHTVPVFRHLCMQDGLIVESRYCPRENCRAPMVTRMHRGIARRQCSKQKCKCITPKYVSAYYTTKGGACIAVVCLCIRHMHQSLHIPSLISQSNMCLCTAHVVSCPEAVTSGRPTGHGPTSCTASLGGQPLVYSHVPCQCLHYPHIHCVMCAYMGWVGGLVVYRFLYPIITA